MKNRTKYSFIVACFLMTYTFASAQILEPRTPSDFDVKQLHCGHSLTSPLFGPWPGQYVELVADENSLQGWQIMGSMVGKADLPGAWLTMHWNYTTSPCWPDCYEPNSNPNAEISNWELLVITENFEGPANNNLNQSRENLLNFVNNSWQNGDGGAGAPTMLWTNWPGIDGSEYFFDGYGIAESTDGSAAGWRQMLDFLEVGGLGGVNGWQAMQDYANDNRMSGCPPVYIIPGNRMMARFYDDVEANLVPTITHVNQLFTDGVHPNNIGAYMITMIHYACIFGQSPVGLSNNIHPDVTIDADLATYIQNMVWDVVTNYPRSGIVESLDVQDIAQSRINVFPNPVSHFLNVEAEGLSTSKAIFDLRGNKLMTTDANTIDVSHLTAGAYLLAIGDEKKLFIKQ
jgi:Secretion system C-terminal sorting domain